MDSAQLATQQTQNIQTTTTTNSNDETITTNSTTQTNRNTYRGTGLLLFRYLLLSNTWRYVNIHRIFVDDDHQDFFYILYDILCSYDSCDYFCTHHELE